MEGQGSLDSEEQEEEPGTEASGQAQGKGLNPPPGPLFSGPRVFGSAPGCAPEAPKIKKNSGRATATSDAAMRLLC